jgi:hypothetical protein
LRISSPIGDLEAPCRARPFGRALFFSATLFASSLSRNVDALELRQEELAIESTNLHRTLDEGGEKKAAPATPKLATRPLKPGARDSGGGFNPYDHAGKKRR